MESTSKNIKVLLKFSEFLLFYLAFLSYEILGVHVYLSNWKKGTWSEKGLEPLQ